jgi:hypothetical protein
MATCSSRNETIKGTCVQIHKNTINVNKATCKSSIVCVRLLFRNFPLRSLVGYM